jgi:hypothetical protein
MAKSTRDEWLKREGALERRRADVASREYATGPGETPGVAPGDEAP